jgi:hypothetical protein
MIEALLILATISATLSIVQLVLHLRLRNRRRAIGEALKRYDEGVLRALSSPRRRRDHV